MTDQPEQVAESKDGRGAGDHDQVYRWGRSLESYVRNLWDQARLTKLRSYVRAGARPGDMAPDDPTADEVEDIPLG